MISSATFSLCGSITVGATGDSRLIHNTASSYRSLGMAPPCRQPRKPALCMSITGHNVLLATFMFMADAMSVGASYRAAKHVWSAV